MKLYWKHEDLSIVHGNDNGDWSPFVGAGAVGSHKVLGGLKFCVKFEGDRSGYAVVDFYVVEYGSSKPTWHQPHMLSSFPNLENALIAAKESINAYFNGDGCGGCKHNRYGLGACEKRAHVNGSLPPDLTCDERSK